jgi:4-hydroxy-4-methyl-2-oxoglutarate aldolase
MNPTLHLSSSDLEKLAALDSCSVSNAIETFNVRLRNEGFITGGLRCMFPELHSTVGYAATCRIRASSPPMTGRCYFNRMDWWKYLLTVQAPRVLVIQDVDRVPGIGAFVGEVHATVGRALQCVGCVTNGAVRDLEGVEATGFQLFAGSVSVSHAYAHIVEFGEPVEIGGLKIRSGDLMHGDRHGVQTVPLSIASEVPRVAEEIRRREQELFAFCRSAEFSFDQLAARFQELS